MEGLSDSDSSPAASSTAIAHTPTRPGPERLGGGKSKKKKNTCVARFGEAHSLEMSGGREPMTYDIMSKGTYLARVLDSEHPSRKAVMRKKNSQLPRRQLLSLVPERRDTPHGVLSHPKGTQENRHGTDSPGFDAHPLRAPGDWFGARLDFRCLTIYAKRKREVLEHVSRRGEAR
jgi:hypothetical protein